MDNIAPQQNGLKWLFLDLNSYFASVEQQDQPQLRGRPVAVVPMQTDSTCAIAASYEAKAYGIKTGTKIYEAKRMCPDLVCVPARHHLYTRYHHLILDEIIKHIPINKVWSIDELSSRLPKRLRSVEAATAIAHQIKAGLRTNVGEAIRCSIGVAPNSFLAKVATDMQKPDGLVILKPEDLPGRLFDLKLTDLPGINVNMMMRLQRNRIATVEQFWNISPKHARRIWGSVGGERFWYNLHGYDIPDIQTKTSVIGHSRVLEPQFRSPDKARMIARRLTIKAATRLRRAELYAGGFAFKCRDQNGERWVGDIACSPAQDNFTFLAALDDLWTQMEATMRPTRLHKIAMTLHKLQKPQEITPDLFAAASSTQQKQSAKNERLTGVMDILQQKFGNDAIQLGLLSGMNHEHTEAKIAFSRVPDLAEFNE
jgi:DNA polymerase-4